MSDGGAGSGVKEGFIHMDFNIEDILEFQGS